MFKVTSILYDGKIGFGTVAVFSIKSTVIWNNRNLEYNYTLVSRLLHTGCCIMEVFESLETQY